MAEWIKNNIPKLKRFYPVIFGAVIGYAYYHFIGCSTGSCAITSNPWTSVLYGSVFGALFISKPKQKPQGEENA
jgi:xanthine/uracil permease